MDQAPNNKHRQIIAGLAVLIVVVVIVAAASLSSKNKAASSAIAPSSDTPTTSVTNTATTTPTATTTGTSSAAQAYKDGDYTATGSYDSPGGSEQITISVSVKGDVVTATSAKAGASDHEAREYQDQFISDYKQEVVGKNIGSLSLNRVSGSSLTSQGFNDALSQIKQQAKA